MFVCLLVWHVCLIDLLFVCWLVFTSWFVCLLVCFFACLVVCACVFVFCLVGCVFVCSFVLLYVFFLGVDCIGLSCVVVRCRGMCVCLFVCLVGFVSLLV